jgi:MFS family permease
MDAQASNLPTGSWRAARRFVILLGIVSLFGDMTYEGARSVVGPFLATLAVSGATVGAVAGTGELVGYALRLVSGYLGDRTGSYWLLTIVGYVINLFSVPLLALAGRWEIAIALIIAERAGRALRTPVRDAMLSHAASRTGAGWAFGLHEALDTTGAIIGPLAVSASLYLGQGYRTSFAMLVVPAVLSLGVLLVARSQFPTPANLELTSVETVERRALPRRFWIFAIAAAFVGAGYADFSLLAFHFGKTAVVAAPWVPVLYALAMAAAAAAAIGLGRAFDSIGMTILIPAIAVAALSAPFAFLGGPSLIALGIVLWGIGMGAQESIMRAIVGTLAPPDRRGTAFGIFHTIFGIAWFLGSVLLGFLYDHSVAAVAIVSLVLQLVAIPILLALSDPRDTGKLVAKKVRR